MLTDAAREGLAHDLAARVGAVALAGRDHQAIPDAPGEARSGAIGNALALEALSNPLFCGRHDDVCAALVAFLCALEQGGAVRAGTSAALLRIGSDAPRRFHVETASHAFTGDLWRGTIRQTLRFVPGAPAAHHGGHRIAFRHHGRRRRLNPAATIARCGIERDAGEVVLFHESPVVAPGLVGLGRTRLGTLRTSYTIRADTPVVRLTLRFEAVSDAAPPRDLRLSTALDAMSGAGADYATLAMRTREGETRRSGFTRRATELHVGAATGIALIGDGTPARAPVIHLRPLTPEALRGVSVTGTARGTIQRMQAEYSAAGDNVTLVEDRLLLTGNPRPDLDGLFARATPERGRDVAACPLPGLIAQALACFLCVSAGAPAEATAARAALGRMLDALRAMLLADAGARDVANLAFLLLAEDALLRLEGDAHRAAHARTLDRLLGAERGDAFGDGVLDRAAALLALARAATIAPTDARIAPAIARTLEASGTGDESGTGDLARALMVRAARAVQAACATGSLTLDDETRLLAGRLTRQGGDWLRERAGAASGAAESAALLLAALAPDAMLMRVAPTRPIAVAL